MTILAQDGYTSSSQNLTSGGQFSCESGYVASKAEGLNRSGDYECVWVLNSDGVTWAQNEGQQDELNQSHTLFQNPAAQMSLDGNVMRETIPAADNPTL
jgi:hypothetical protein